MSRVTLAVCAILLATGPTRAADPQPLWEIDTARPMLLPGKANWLGFSPNGKLLVALLEATPQREKDAPGFSRNVWRLVAWDTTTHKETFDVDLGPCDSRELRLQTCAITDDGRILVPGDVAREVCLSDGKVTDLTRGPKNIEHVWFEPKTRRVCYCLGGELSALSVGRLPPLDSEGKRPVAKWVKSPVLTDTLDAVTVTPDGKRVVAATTKHLGANGAKEYGLTTWAFTPENLLGRGDSVDVSGTHCARISSIAFGADGKTLALGSENSSVSLWDVTKPEKEWKAYATVPTGKFSVGCLAFSPDGRTLAAGELGQKARPALYMIDVRGGKVVSSRWMKGGVTALTYSPDGKLLVTAETASKTLTCQIRVWDAAAVRGD
jgi:WD40 repeat protein